MKYFPVRTQEEDHKFPWQPGLNGTEYAWHLASTVQGAPGTWQPRPSLILTAITVIWTRTVLGINLQMISVLAQEPMSILAQNTEIDRAGSDSYTGLPISVHCTPAKVGKDGYISELFFQDIFVSLWLDIKSSFKHLQKLKTCQNLRLDLGENMINFQKLCKNVKVHCQSAS